MIKIEMVQDLLNQFYDYISFEEGEEPKFEKFKELFIKDALVIEYMDDGYQEYIQKNINGHIDEMNKVFNDYPQIKDKGFREKELENNIEINGPMAFVKSRYRKEYFNGKTDVISIGTNCMQLAIIGNRLKVISIVFYE